MYNKLKELSKYKIIGKDGEIGNIFDFYFDDKIWTIRYIAVNAGNWLLKNLVLISPIFIFIEDISTENETIKINLTNEQVKNSPDIDTEKPISRQHEMTLMDYYGAGYYWAGFDTWGMYSLPVGLRDVAVKNKKEKRANENIYLRSMNEVLNYKAAAADDDFGRFKDMLVNIENWSVDYFILNTNVILPGDDITFNIRLIRSISYDESTVYFFSTKEAMEDME
jgi:hypothetical protein